MVKAILIGFEYSDKILTGAGNDLYRMYKYCHPWDRILFTDIKDGIDRTIEFPLNVNRHIFKNKTDFLDKLGTELETDENLILYFSGHGENQSIILPNREEILTTELSYLIRQKVNPQCQIVIIFDCCYPNNLKLPFKLIDGKFKKIKNSFISHDIILITSCEETRKSAGQSSGSAFTREFLDSSLDSNFEKIFSHVTRRIERETGHIQQACVYSSFPRLPFFWTWFSRSKIEYSPGSDYIIVT